MEICGLPAIKVRDALRKFNDQQLQCDFVDGVPKLIPKRLSAAFLAEALAMAGHEATKLLNALVSSGYVDQAKLTPTYAGMALIAAEDRDRLSLNEAEALLEEFLKAVQVVNAKPKARVFIEKVRIFGSFAEGKETVGDIDLQVFAPLPEDCQPKDCEEQEAVISEVKTSDYLSFHDEFDQVATAAPGKIIYQRNAAPNA